MNPDRSWRRAVDYVELTLSTGFPQPLSFPHSTHTILILEYATSYRFLLLYDQWRINFIEAGLI